MGWRSLGKPGGGAAASRGSIAVLRDGAGSLEMFVVALDGSVFSSTQLTVDRWLSWTQIGWRSDTAVAAALRPDRRVQVFALNGSGTLLTSIRQGSRWTAWSTLGHGLTGGIATAVGANGSILVLGGSLADTFAVRSGDLQAFDLPSTFVLKGELAEAQAQAWTSLAGLPRLSTIGSSGEAV
jgi:hypothetical protein